MKNKTKITQVERGISLFYQYIYTNMYTVKKGSVFYSGFLLDINKTIINNKIAVGSSSLGLSLFSLIKGIDEDKRKEINDYIIKNQLGNGSWTISSLVDYDISLIYTTCYAITSLILSDKESNREYIDLGIKWLISIQNEDGGWGIQANSNSHIHSTSEVLTLFSLYEYSRINTSSNRAKEWLISQRKKYYWCNDNNKASVYYTALCYKGLTSIPEFKLQLKGTRKWLLKRLRFSPCKEEVNYHIVKKDGHTIHEHINAFTRSVVFESLMSARKNILEPVLIRECNIVLKRQNKLGYWSCPHNKNDSPIFLNYYICCGLIKFLQYLERNEKYLFLEKLKELYCVNRLYFFILAFFVLTGIYFFTESLGSVFSFIIKLPSITNNFFTPYSGIANFITISGISFFVVFAYVLKKIWNKKRGK